ncbi:putative reverse transcriptase domain-containing protein, partial [Tanacetum coccineum]
PAAASQGGGTGGRASRGSGRTRGRSGDQGNGKIDGQGGQVGGQGSEVNDGVNGVPDLSTIIAQQLQNLLPTIVAQGCTYKEFLACNPKEYNGKGGAIVYTRWIEKMESVQDMSGCRDNQKVKYIAGSFLGKALMWWNSQIHTRGQEATVGEPSKDRNVRDGNKRTRTENAFATTTNTIGRENTGTVPKCTTCNTHHLPGASCHTCFNCNCPCHFSKDCRVVHRNVNPINARNLTVSAYYECGSTDHVKSACPRLNQPQRPRETINQVVAVNGGQGRRNQGNQARGRAFMLGAEEARQDLNIMTGMFTLNEHYATTLFDSGADYIFVSTTFIPLLGIEPSDLGFSYEIKIASRQLVDINKVIRGCKLEIEGHVFDINLIPFGSRSFDVIIGMDWLSDHKAEIICHENVVRIPLLDGKVLRVLGEKPKEKEIEFRIKLVPGAMPISKSPYRLIPFELEELSGQLKELQDKGFIRPSSSP